MINTAIMLGAMQRQLALSGPIPIAALTLTNPGAESASTTGWTVSSGSFTTPSDGFVNSGTYAFASSATGSQLMYQDVAVNPAHYAQVDAGGMYISIEYAGHNRDSAAQDAVNVYADFYNGAPGTLISTGKVVEAFPAERLRAWRTLGTGWVPIPAGTRTYRIYVNLFAQNGVCDSRIDDIVVKVGTIEFGDMVFSNPGAELGNFSGWSDGSGPYDFGVDDGTLYPGVTGKIGTYFFYTLATSTTQSYDHTGTLPVAGGWDTSIDAGVVFAQAEMKIASTSVIGTQGCYMDFLFLNNVDATISTVTEVIHNGYARVPNNTFRQRRSRPIAVPVNTRKIKARVRSHHNGSNRTNMWDDVKVRLVRETT